MEKALIELRDFERNAKRLYESNPAAFDHVVWSWEEFVDGFRKTQRESVPLEEKAPFFMGNLLTEQDCFPEERMEVSIVLHDRYVPPFYHSLKFIKIVYALRKGFFFYLREKGQDRRSRMEEGDFVIIPPEVSQAVFSAEEGAVTVNIIIKRSTFGEAFYSLLMENDDISDFFWQMLYSKGNERALLVRCGRDERLQELVREMCAEGLLDRAGSRAGKNLMMKGYVMLLFGRALKEHSGRDGKRGTPERGGRGPSGDDPLHPGELRHGDAAGAGEAFRKERGLSEPLYPPGNGEDLPLPAKGVPDEAGRADA